MIRATRKLFSRARPQCAGSVLIEAAISLPVLLAMLAAAIELGRFFIVNQKVAGLASAVADMIAQAETTLAESEVSDVFAAIEHVSRPFEIAQEGRVIVSGIVGSGNGNNVIAWQRCSGAVTTTSSRFGPEGTQNVTLPGNIVLAQNDVSIFAEVSYSYRPLMFDTVIPQKNVRGEAVFRPRFGAITALTADALPSTC